MPEVFRVRRTFLLALLISGCGGAAAPAPSPPPKAPARVALGGPVVEELLTNLAAGSACSGLGGSFLGIVTEKQDGPKHASLERVGRWWVQDCSVRRDNDELVVELAGPAWQWVDQTKRQAGAKFKVSQYVRMSAGLEMRGRLDLSYAKERQVVSLWFTPSEPTSATVQPIGSVEVKPEGIWSHVLGAVVTATTLKSPDKKGEESVKSEGSGQMEQSFNRGLTITVDLCTGQRDMSPVPLDEGATPERPYPSAGRLWLQNERVRLHPGGLDVAGPFEASTKLVVEIEVEEGQALTAELVCLPEAYKVVSAFIKGEKNPAVAAKAHAVALGGSPAELVAVPDETCPSMALVTRPSAESAQSGILFRFIAYEQTARVKPLVVCDAAKPAR